MMVAGATPRGPLLPTMVIVGALLFLSTILAAVWTDVLWYRSVHFAGVFTTSLLSRLGLFVAGFVAAGTIVAASLVFAYRSRPFYVPLAEDNESLEQYREAIEPLRRVALIIIPGIIGALAGAALSGQWKTFLAWRNQISFGQVDAHFGRDISFFIFTLPWIETIIGFVTMILIAAFFAGAFTHYVYGGLRIPGRGDSSRAAIIQLSILGAGLALTRAAAYWFDRFALSTKESPLMTGIRYTDAHAVLPTKAILSLAAIMCALMFLATIYTRSWRLPIIGVALLTVTSIVVGGIYPAVIAGPRMPIPHKASRAAPAVIDRATTRSLWREFAATMPPTNMPPAPHNM